MPRFVISALLLLSGIAYGQRNNPDQINGTAVVQSPAAGQNINMPVGTTFSVNSLNGVLNASLFPGSDLGAKVQAAITLLGSSCGTVMIPSGTYTWTTHKVILNPCQRLEGNSSLVNTSTGTDPAIVIAGVPNFMVDPHVYDQGGISNLTLSGPGPGTSQTGSMGIMIGGDPAGIITPTNFVAFTMALHNVHVRSYGCGLNFGLAFQIAVFGGTLENNFTGACFQAGPGSGGENFNFHGTQIINNIKYGIRADSTGAVELNLYGVSLDYNGQVDTTGAQIFINNVYSLNIFGGHFENHFTPYIVVPAGPNQATINISDVRFTLANLSPTPINLPSIIQVAGTSSIVHIDGLSFNNLSPAATLPASLIDYTPAGFSSLFVKNFYSTFQNNGLATPILKAGNSTPAFFDLPEFDAAGDIVSSTTNEIRPNILSVPLSVVAGAGMQHFRAAGGCATGAAVGATCTTDPMTWAAAMSDTNYTISCTLSNPTGVPTVSSVNRISGTQFTVTIAALTPVIAGGDLNCIAMHD
jgi:hypothetical protein